MTDSIYFVIGSWIIVTNGHHRIFDSDLPNALIMPTMTYVDCAVTGSLQEKPSAAYHLVSTYSMKNVMTLQAHYMQQETMTTFSIKEDVHVTCVVVQLHT